MSMPQQKPGRSKQDYQTPPEFLDAVKARLQNEFAFDLAASAENVDGLPYWDQEDNALVRDWAAVPPIMFQGGTSSPWLWLNPPYSDIEPWVRKCAEESARGAHIACLVPASVGSNWWRDWVVPHAYILFLNGRIQFVGADGPYPKDLALLLYTPFIRSGSDTWNWRTEVVNETAR